MQEEFANFFDRGAALFDEDVRSRGKLEADSMAGFEFFQALKTFVVECCMARSEEQRGSVQVMASSSTGPAGFLLSQLRLSSADEAVARFKRGPLRGGSVSKLNSDASDPWAKRQFSKIWTLMEPSQNQADV